MVGEFPYRMPRVEALVAQKSLQVETLHQGDLALLVHLASFFRAKAMRVFRPTMQGSKRTYDETGEVSKTPFALSEVTDDTERHFLTRNTFSFATVNGCMGGRWGCARPCYLAALQIKSSKFLEQIPFEQKCHFFDETLEPMTSEERSAWMDEFYMHDDNDPFDDQDLERLMDYLYDKYGIVPGMTTTIPTHAEAKFKRLTGDAMQYDRVGDLERFLTEVERVRAVIADSPFTSGREIREKRKEVEGPYEQRLDILSNLAWSVDAEGVSPAFLWEDPEPALAQLNEWLEYCELPQMSLDENVTSLVIDALFGAMVQKKKEDLAEQGLDLDIDLKDMHTSVDDALESAGLDDAEFLNVVDDTNLDRLRRVIEEMKDSLKGRADMGEAIRVTELERRGDLIWDLGQTGDHLFERTGFRDEFFEAGKPFYDSEKKVGEYASDCHDGIVVTPFGVFNVLVGKVTRAFPRGRVMVPFKGFKKEWS